MTFEEILDQALAMLQRRGRVTYRTLQRQFNLDDAALEDLKEALFYEHSQVVEDPGQGLRWKGDLPSIPQSAPQELSTDPRAPEAERRQLTVLFCDLVDSTALASQLDPEEWREVVRAYQATCAEVIQRFDGHIAQYLGDGLLVYFGYPQAHEDDAQRGVRAGLDMVKALERLNMHLVQDQGIQLAVRIGIHTGVVVVGEMGGGGRREQLALGETPNVAARLQSLATRNQVVISTHTRQLVGGAFDLEELGLHKLKGLPMAMSVYSVRGESTAESRFEAASTTGMTPLIGREEEISLVLRRWEQAKAGDGQVVLLAGEAGIGKSRLAQTVRERLAAEPHVRLLYQCSPYYSHSAFYPIIAQLERASRFARDDTPAQKLDKLETLLAQGTARVAEVTPLFAALLSIPTDDRYPLLSLSPERQKVQTIAALLEQLVGLSCHQPVLLLLEDAHWCDPTTIEVLDQLVGRVPDLRMLVVITYRPEFVAPWTAVSHVTALTLTRLSRPQGAAMVAQLAGDKALPQDVLDQIHVKTDGVPLFVEELTKAILESELLRATDDRYELIGPLPPLAIPATLQGALMARLDRLAPVKEVAQIGAALGREFSYEVLAAVTPWRDQALDEALHQLVAAGLLFRRGQLLKAQYRFKHALVQEAAYASLLKSRRQQLHARITTVLEAQFPELCETQPELLAHHYTAAGLHAQAVVYWQRAGQRANQRSASVEASAHFTQGLAVLAALPETPARATQELTLQTALGAALMVTQGNAAPDVAQAYHRARELCQQLGERTQLIPVLLGLRAFYQVRGALHTARELGEQVVALARQAPDHAHLSHAHYSLGHTLYTMGQFGAARESLEQGIARYDRRQHRPYAFAYGQDPGVFNLATLAWVLWHLGYPDHALACTQEALALAQDLAHAPSLEHALTAAAQLHQFRREAEATQQRAEMGMTISRQQSFQMRIAMGTMLWGWAFACTGQEAEGTAQLRQGLIAYQATGAEAFGPYFLTLLAEVYQHGGHTTEGLQVLAQARAMADKNVNHFRKAEIHRLTGELVLQPASPDVRRAEACFQQALDVARRQQAKSLELRAAMSLSRLWLRQGKRHEARELLAEIYGWFTEGFDTADLQEAKALLEELSR